jgi:hypothetical protein
VRRFGERGEGERAREREAAGPAPPEGGAGGGDGPLLRKERRSLSVLPSRGRKAGSRGRRSRSIIKKSLCPRPSEDPLLPQGRQHPRRGPPPSGRGGRRGRGGRWAPTAPGGGIAGRSRPHPAHGRRPRSITRIYKSTENPSSG